MGAASLSYQGYLETQTCGACGIEFAAPKSFFDERRKDHKKNWYCPNGHARIFTGETEAERLARELEAERNAAARLRADLGAKTKSVIALRGQVTKSRKRAAAGVCPCCKRTFRQLAAHMGMKHPDYAAQDIGSGVPAEKGRA
jgi:hypothetical protein